jgi:protein-disulfide isomerase
LGLTLSAYLGWHFLMGGPVIGCGGGSPCEQVLNSRWSTIGGILPVSGLAEGAYLAMLVLVGAAAGSALWFIFVQKWLVGAFCPYCMATHITGLLLAALVIWQAPRRFEDDSKDVAPKNPAPATGAVMAAPIQDVSRAVSRRIIGPLPAIGLTLVGVALAGIMAVSQAVFTPAAVFRAGQAAENNLPALDPRAVPLIGSPDARYVVTLLFDYQCPHCQQLHSLLDEAVRRYHGKLAFALCPAPLNPQCNPYVSRETDEFRDSCDLAKIGLAVWVAKRDAFPDFDRWMYSPEPGHLWHPRTPDAAAAKAVELVGQAKFEAARAEPWGERYLQTSVRIYGEIGGSALPKLVYGSHWVTPELHDANELVLILHDGLGVPQP